MDDKDYIFRLRLLMSKMNPDKWYTVVHDNDATDWSIGSIKWMIEHHATIRHGYVMIAANQIWRQIHD